MKDYHFDDFAVPQRIKKKLQDPEWIKKELAKGKTAQEILCLTDEAMTEFYKGACYLFEKECYFDAANAFLFLVTLNPTNPEYWLGLGMSTQQCGNYEDAITAYEFAAHYKLDSPVPYFYLAKCLFAVRDQESALRALDLAVEYAADQVEFADLKRQAMQARMLLLGSE